MSQTEQQVRQMLQIQYTRNAQLKRKVTSTVHQQCTIQQDE